MRLLRGRLVADGTSIAIEKTMEIGKQDVEQNRTVGEMIVRIWAQEIHLMPLR